MTATTLSPENLATVVGAAIRAPSQHNSQPWRFRARRGGVDVVADRSRQLPVADPSGWGLRIGCGAAIYNLRLAFAVIGTPAEVRLRPDPTDPDLLARLSPGPSRRPTPIEKDLYAAVFRRRSNRDPFSPEPVPAEVRARLIAAAREEGAWLELLLGSGALAALSEVTRAADRVLTRDARYTAEIAAWTRREPGPDGVPAEAGGPSPEPHDLLAMRDFGGRPRAPGRDFEPEPLVGVLGVAGDSPIDQLVAGQALQRVLLTITDAGLAASLLSQPIEVPAAREQLRIGLGRFGVPQMVIRIGYGQPGPLTPRRPVEEVLEIAPD